MSRTRVDVTVHDGDQIHAGYRGWLFNQEAPEEAQNVVFLWLSGPRQVTGYPSRRVFGTMRETVAWLRGKG